MVLSPELNRGAATHGGPRIPTATAVTRTRPDSRSCAHVEIRLLETIHCLSEAGGRFKDPREQAPLSDRMSVAGGVGAVRPPWNLLHGDAIGFEVGG